LKTVASKLAKYKFDPVAIQDVRWDKDSNQPAHINFSTAREILIIT